MGCINSPNCVSYKFELTFASKGNKLRVLDMVFLVTLINHHILQVLQVQHQVNWLRSLLFCFTIFDGCKILAPQMQKLNLSISSSPFKPWQSTLLGFMLALPGPQYLGRFLSMSYHYEAVLHNFTSDPKPANLRLDFLYQRYNIIWPEVHKCHSFYH